MISLTDNIDEIKPIFREYLDFISRFYTITDHEAWCAGGMKSLQKYPAEPDRYVYVLKEADQIIGFALVNKHLRFNPDGFAVAEFYIQDRFQRRGYGRKLAEHVFNQWPGNWEVAVALKNDRAVLFWKQVLSVYVNGKFQQRTIASFNGCGFLFNNS